MTGVFRSYSLIEFLENAHAFIERLNQTREPFVLTIDGKVQAVFADPASYQLLAQEAERGHLLAAISEGERAIQEGRIRPVELAFEELAAKYGFSVS